MGYRVGFVMELSLGHATVFNNVSRWFAEKSDLDPVWLTVPPWVDDRWARWPLVRGNYSLAASFRARDYVREALREGPLDGLYYYTQSAALLSLPWLKRIPTVVTMDATPLNMDAVASGYNHRAARLNRNPIDALKFRWDRRVFRGARALVGYSEWVKASLTRDYGIEPSKVEVIPPSIDLDAWPPAALHRPVATDEGRPVRLLFVGGDFERKGGRVLLEALRPGLSRPFELDVVSRDPAVQAEGPVRVHRGMTPNCPELKRLFAESDIFVFPTLGDCTPQVTMEAMATGLPVVAADVGAIGEQVADGTTGFLVPPGDPAALRRALNVLLDDPARRHAFGFAGRAAAERLFSTDRNYGRLLDVILRSIEQSPRARDPRRAAAARGRG